jgi:beta-lactamase class A
MTLRRMFLYSLAFLSLTVSVPAAVNSQIFSARLEELVQRAKPGVLGIMVLDPQTGATWGVNADRPFPMMSVFKAPVAAAVLSQVDAGRLTLTQKVTVRRTEVDEGSAVPSIGNRFKGESMSFTVDELLTAAVSQSDNTAVDALIRVVGGPEKVTEFLRSHGIQDMRVDEDEAAIAREMTNNGGKAEAPEGETAAQEHARLTAGYQTFLADPRNHSTPRAAALFLEKLENKELLSRGSTEYLLKAMEAQTVPRRMRAGLPQEVRLADKTGSSGTVEGLTAAYNDIGLLQYADGRTVIVAAFLSESNASQAARDALFADVARATTAATTHP